MVEHCPFKAGVLGSSPSRLTVLTVPTCTQDSRLHPRLSRKGIPAKIDSFKGAFEKKELPTPKSGAMCYMMSNDAYLGARTPT
jgi:hypothetical protein